MIKRFRIPIVFAAASSTTSTNEVVNFEDFSNVRCVSWVGESNNNVDVEIRTHDGRNTLVDSVPVEYLKLGTGREELEMNEILANNSLRVITSFETGKDVKGCLVFTCEK